MVDSSNHGPEKLVPIVIRYFHIDSGINVKVLELETLPGETSDRLNDYVFSVLNRNGLVDKVIGMSADNTNTNFGGAKRKGVKNLFQKLSVSCNKTLIGVGCIAHVINNCINNAADSLPIDAEVIIVKLFKFFYIYTVRVTELKTFCEFVGVEYKKILSYSNTRWLRLLPALERVLQMIKPLKAYFGSLENPPAVLKTFFEDPNGELWLWFLHNVAATFHETVKKIEGDKVSAAEAASEYFRLYKNLQERKSKCFLPLKVKELQKEIPQTEHGLELFKQTACIFYDNCIAYLDLWKANLDSLQQLSWASLKEQPKWEDLEESWSLFRNVIPSSASLDDMFNELCVVNSYLTDDRLAEWAERKLITEERWLSVFKDLRNKEITIPNLKKMCEFVLALPGTNASVERAFSIINNLWLTEKASMTIECVKSLLIIQMNYSETCIEMYEKIKKNKTLTNKLSSTEKYDWSKPSTSFMN